MKGFATTSKNVAGFAYQLARPGKTNTYTDTPARPSKVATKKSTK
jgi:hypothetical protein